MSSINIRKNPIQQLTNENIYRIDGRLISEDSESDNIDVVWTFETVSLHEAPLLHSKNTEESVYLNYNPAHNPLMEIYVPGSGTYKIKLRAKITRMEEQSVEVTNIDLNDNIVITTEIKPVPVEEIVESGELTITIDEKDWV